jgi:exopolyphosphatase/guanosine-5'-triphosphate,3'-diphosphate pyrophosphatase
MQGENLAAIDLGTNSCRLRITDKSGNIIYREAVTTKLGEGLAENMCFTPEAIERGVRCLSRFAEHMTDYEVGHYRAVTTASCRMASNGTDFVQKVEETCGLKLEIISPLEEATLTLKGAILNADKNKPYVLVYDLGGGSTEITLATNTAKPEILHTISIPWGARNSSEVFNLAEYNADNALKLATEIKKWTIQFMQNSDFAKYRDNCCCLATSSTPLRLISMVKNTGVYSKEYADGVKASIPEIEKQIQKVFAMDLTEMTQNPYIGESRYNIFTAACVIFSTIYQTLQIKELTASLKGAQEAIIEELRQQWQN